MAGSTLGLYGFGSIARDLARKALALDMQVLALRRSPQPFGLDGVQRAADIHELFARADHLVLAAPATAETHHVVNRQTLASARPGLHLINVARARLVTRPHCCRPWTTGAWRSPASMSPSPSRCRPGTRSTAIPVYG